MRRRVSALPLLGVTMAVVACAPAEERAETAAAAETTTAEAPRAETPSPAQESPLYDRLGGVINIAPVVDDFIDRLLVNDAINANPRVKAARDRVPASYLKFHVTSLVCEVTGGPCTYTGRSMKEAHAHLMITEPEWQAMLSDFRATLNAFGVPEREQGELVAIVESTKGDIVVSDQM